MAGKLTMRQYLDDLTIRDGSVPTRNSSLADTPREDGKEWQITRIPQISAIERNRIRKKLPKFSNRGGGKSF